MQLKKFKLLLFVIDIGRTSPRLRISAKTRKSTLFSLAAAITNNLTSTLDRLQKRLLEKIDFLPNQLLSVFQPIFKPFNLNQQPTKTLATTSTPH